VFRETGNFFSDNVTKQRKNTPQGKKEGKRRKKGTEKGERKHK
jgi:hypothetical protein